MYKRQALFRLLAVVGLIRIAGGFQCVLLLLRQKVQLIDNQANAAFSRVIFAEIVTVIAAFQTAATRFPFAELLDVYKRQGLSWRSKRFPALKQVNTLYV